MQRMANFKKRQKMSTVSQKSKSDKSININETIVAKFPIHLMTSDGKTVIV